MKIDRGEKREFGGLSFRFSTKKNLRALNRKFFLLSSIGNGATCEVFKACPESFFCETTNQASCALKVFSKSFLEIEKSTEYIAREVSILSKLSEPENQHPNITQLRDVLVDFDLYDSKKLYVTALVMDYADFGDLYEYLFCSTGVSLSIEFTQAVFQQLVRAVKHIHSLNIIHSDIKPENILLKSNGLVMLTDFGFAQFANVMQHDDASSSESAQSEKEFTTSTESLKELKTRKIYRSQTQIISHAQASSNLPKNKSLSSLGKLSSSSETRRRLMIKTSGGTAEYKSPEAMEHSIYNPAPVTSFDGAAADMWSLGVVLHVMIFGRLPGKNEYSKKPSVPESYSKFDVGIRAPASDSWGKSFNSKKKTFEKSARSPTLGKLLNYFSNSLLSEQRGDIEKIEDSNSKDEALHIIYRLLRVKPEKRDNADILSKRSWVCGHHVLGGSEVVRKELMTLQIYRKSQVKPIDLSLNESWQ